MHPPRETADALASDRFFGGKPFICGTVFGRVAEQDMGRRGLKVRTEFIDCGIGVGKRLNRNLSLICCGKDQCGPVPAFGLQIDPQKGLQREDMSGPEEKEIA